MSVPLSDEGAWWSLSSTGTAAKFITVWVEEASGTFCPNQIHLRSIHSENLQPWQVSRAPPTNTTDCVRLQLMDDFDQHDLKAANCKKGKGSLQLVFHCDC